ncbi:MAG TPA: site-2 protease family protein [Dongiaceae bacterium]|jgi:Zn-dependent protease|nr:site-2 protease family protein [Dongiaceae bacterium]
MNADTFSATLHQLSTWVLPVLIGITLHEAAHGYVAWLRGDDTAYRLGRVSFNPLVHIDPMGTVLLPALLYMAGGFLFGYAKPVPVAFQRLRNPRWDSVLVAAAGPGINLVLALVSALLLHAVTYMPDVAAGWAGATLVNSLELNIWLAVFNLLPVPPLDGGRILVGIVPRPIGARIAALEPYGMWIVLFLLFLLPVLLHRNIIGGILFPIVDYIRSAIIVLTGVGS